MKKIKQFTSFFILGFGFPLLIFAQGTAINETGANAHASAILDVDQSNSGVLIPRLTTEQIQSVNDPANGLWVFNITDEKFYVYNSIDVVWKEIAMEEPVRGGVLIDHRDGKRYKTVKIGQQYWMAENLNIGKFINTTNGGANKDGQQTNDNTIEKYCYDNDENYCIKYGGLYQWNEMMQYSSGEIEIGICPEGWHIPSDYEWSQLISYLALNGVSGSEGKALKSSENWKGDPDGLDAYGFNGLPAGNWSKEKGFDFQMLNTMWWSSTQRSSIVSSHRILTSNEPVLDEADCDKDYGFSVRCLKNN